MSTLFVTLSLCIIFTLHYYFYILFSLSSKPLKSQGHRGLLGQATILTRYSTFLPQGKPHHMYISDYIRIVLMNKVIIFK